MLPLALLLGCPSSSPSDDPPTSSTDSGTAPLDSATPSGTAGPSGTTGTSGTTGSTGSTGDTASGIDCGSLPALPLATSTLTGPPASEDFAFDGPEMISHQGSFLVRTGYPPSTPAPWSPTDGSPGGPASMRRLSTGDLVYHNVDTGSLYRVEPSGAATTVLSGFGYAGGIEVHPTDRVYVVDLGGVHRIDPYGTTHDLTLQSAPWQSGNGITLSVDSRTLYVSARDGVWSTPVDVDGRPEGPPTLWGEPPPSTFEMTGMGVDACDQVYVTAMVGTGSSLLRYPPTGGMPEVVAAAEGASWANLQWGSGEGGWDDHTLYVVDRGTGFVVVPVGVPEKPRP